MNTTNMANKNTTTTDNTKVLNMRTAGGRHELKHYINYSDYMQLRSRLPCVTTPDENTKNGEGYRVRSLYFDNYRDKALREKRDGVNDREKFRLRLYNDDISYIRLEKKSKKNGICFKETALVSATACESILSGSFTVLRDSENPLLLEFYTKILHQQLRPKNIVDYKREAYVFRAGNVRVTLDYDIRTTGDTQAFLDAEIVTVPIPGAIILEVKYDNFLPEVIRGIVALSGRHSAPFSKYAVARII